MCDPLLDGPAIDSINEEIEPNPDPHMVENRSVECWKSWRV